MNFLRGLIYLSPIFLFGDLDHLIFSELVLTPSNSEYVKITNPTDSDIDLSNYYLTDGTDIGNGEFYYQLPSGTNYWSGSSSDFICRFPSGYTISAGVSITVSLRDSSKYASEFGENADLTLNDDLLDAVDDESTKGSSAAPKLGNTNETLILFYWDGSSTTVKDIDYLLWGDNSFAIDKTGVDGYQSDTPAASQAFLPIHNTDEKLVRISEEGSENQSGGNGITGHDETSESFNETWGAFALVSSKPEISAVTVSPESPTTEETITFTATVTDDEGLSSVELTTIFQSDTTSHTMNQGDGDQFSVSINSLEQSGALIYYVVAVDVTGLSETTNLFSLTISVPPEPPQELTIADLLNNLDDYVGEQIEIDGVVTVPAGKLRTTFTEAFLQDESGKGIILYNSSLDTSFHRGDSVMVTAEVDEFDGKPELIYSNIQILKGNAKIPTVELSISEFNTLEYDYTFVKIWGKITERSDPYGTNAGANITIQDEAGEQSIVRIWASTGVLHNDSFELVNESLDSLLQVGTMIEVSGIGGSYSGTSQLQPAYASDIYEKLEGTPGDFEIYLKVAPYPFVPQLGEQINFEYSFPDDARIKLRVFDATGRYVTTLYDEYRGISFYKETSWNGRDALNRVLPPGVYIMHLEVTDTKTGTLNIDTAPVVIGLVGR
jgi:DNA/RNA endonuclease YhcR with UshA esterase domain